MTRRFDFIILNRLHPKLSENRMTNVTGSVLSNFHACFVVNLLISHTYFSKSWNILTLFIVWAWKYMVLFTRGNQTVTMQKFRSMCTTMVCSARPMSDRYSGIPRYVSTAGSIFFVDTAKDIVSIRHLTTSMDRQ